MPRDKRLPGTAQSDGPTQKNETELKTTMSRLLKSSFELPPKPLAFSAIAGTNVSQFQGFRTPATPGGWVNLLAPPTDHTRASIADTGGWHHGGIDE